MLGVLEKANLFSYMDIYLFLNTVFLCSFGCQNACQNCVWILPAKLSKIPKWRLFHNHIFLLQEELRWELECEPSFSDMSNAPAASKRAEYQLPRTWRDFQRALYAPSTETFLPVVWICRLVRAGLHDVAFSLGFSMADKLAEEESNQPEPKVSSSIDSLHVAPRPLNIQPDLPTDGLADVARILSIKSRKFASDDDESISDSSHSTNAQDCTPNKMHLTGGIATSRIGLDVLLEQRRIVGGLGQNMVRIEGLSQNMRAIEEVYDGVHDGRVLGVGISGIVRLVTHRMTGYKYAVKVFDLDLIDTPDALDQLREESFNMCQVSSLCLVSKAWCELIRHSSLFFTLTQY